MHSEFPKIAAKTFEVLRTDRLAGKDQDFVGNECRVHGFDGGIIERSC
jgi:hypothetical protein